MTTPKQIEIGNAILATNIIKKVFHSVQLLRSEDSNVLYPVYPIGAEYSFAGLDDTAGLFAYIRINGDITTTALRVGSCAGGYRGVAPLRVVFFNDSEDRNHEDLIDQLAAFTFLSNVALVRIITDKYRLLREESPLFRAKFDAKTFYIAIDVNAAFEYLPNSCEPEKCIIQPNPLTPCHVAATGSIDSATS